MARHSGRKGAVYLSPTLAGAVAAVIALTQWSLDMTTDKIDVTAFQDTNKVYVQGLPDIKGAVAGWWDDTDDALFAGAESTEGVMLVLYPDLIVPTQYHRGPAWLDASLAVDVKGAVSSKGNFVAAGSWSRFP